MPRRSMLDQQEEETEIMLSPMIDCVFILLIFFIVTTVFVDETGLQVNKPDAAAPSALDQKETVTLEISAENKIFLGGKELAIEAVTGSVKAGMLGPDTPVVVRAHEKADHGTFVAVWDAAGRAGAQMLSFNTVN